MEDSLDPRNPFSRLCSRKFSRVTGELNLSKIAIGPFEDRWTIRRRDGFGDSRKEGAIFHGLGERVSKLSPTRLPRKPAPLEGNGTMPMLFRSMIERACVPRSGKSVPPDLSLALPLRTPSSRANRIRHPVPRMTFPSVPPGARCVHRPTFLTLSPSPLRFRFLKFLHSRDK